MARNQGLKAGLISLGSTSSQWTVEAMENYFDEVEMIYIKKLEINFSGKNAEVLYKGEPLGHYDCIYQKGSFRYAQLLRSITSLLWDEMYLPIAPSTFTTVHDKLLTQLELQKHDIPMPRTYLASTTDEAKNILDRINYPIIMKLPKGTHGKGVMFAETRTSAASLLDALAAMKQPFIIQEFIETRTDESGGADIRAIVIGDEVVAAMKRTAEGDDIRANLHSGADGEKVNLDPHARNLAVKVAKAIGADIAGVDLLQSHKGPMVIEANASPGLQGITKVSGVDVADKIAEYLYTRTAELRDKEHQKKSGEIMSEINSDNGSSQSFITDLDFRGSRILLPEVVTKLTGFKDTDEFHVTAEPDKVEIKKFDI